MLREEVRDEIKTNAALREYINRQRVITEQSIFTQIATESIVRKLLLEKAVGVIRQEDESLLKPEILRLASLFNQQDIPIYTDEMQSLVKQVPEDYRGKYEQGGIYGHEMRAIAYSLCQLAGFNPTERVGVSNNVAIPRSDDERLEYESVINDIIVVALQGTLSPKDFQVLLTQLNTMVPSDEKTRAEVRSKLQQVVKFGSMLSGTEFTPQDDAIESHTALDENKLQGVQWTNERKRILNTGIPISEKRKKAQAVIENKISTIADLKFVDLEKKGSMYHVYSIGDGTVAKVLVSGHNAGGDLEKQAEINEQDDRLVRAFYGDMVPAAKFVNINGERLMITEDLSAQPTVSEFLRLHREVPEALKHNVVLFIAHYADMLSRTGLAVEALDVLDAGDTGTLRIDPETYDIVIADTNSLVDFSRSQPQVPGKLKSPDGNYFINELVRVFNIDRNIVKDSLDVIQKICKE